MPISNVYTLVNNMFKHDKEEYFRYWRYCSEAKGSPSDYIRAEGYPSDCP